MTLENTLQLIRNSLRKMRLSFSDPLFDEWLILSLQPGNASLVHYEGPRPEAIQASLKDDLQMLREELCQDSHVPGDFAFARDADGSAFDAFLAIGEGIFVLFNHTTKTIEEITRVPEWKAAQTHFVAMSESFRLDPVRL